MLNIKTIAEKFDAGGIVAYVPVDENVIAFL